MLGIGFVANAQDNSIYDAKIEYGQTYHYYTGQTADTLGTADTTWSYTYWKLSDAVFANYTQVKLDSVSGSPGAVSVLFETRINKLASWVTDSTVIWYGTTSDSLITYDATTNRAFPYRRIKILDADSDFKVKVNSLRQLFLK